MADNVYDRIRPNKNKAASYDLVGNYDWTSVPRTAALRDEAPAAWITAYELKYSALRSFIDGYMNVLSPQNSNSNYANSKTPGLDFYKGLYAVGDTPIARFSFPYFTDNIRAFSTEFSDTFSTVSQRGAKMLGADFIQGLGGAGESFIGGTAAAVTQFGHLGNPGGTGLMDKIAKNTQAAVGKVGETFFKAMGVENPGLQTMGAPGTYIETPMFYQYGNTDNTLDIGFALSNTLNADAIEKNYKFIKDFTFMNRPFRTGPIGMNFPAIYQIVVPGVRYIQWAYLSDFNIGMIGSRRKIEQPGTGRRCKIVPEAYSCQFSFRSLTVEAANFIDELEKYCGYASYGTQMLNQEKELLHNQEIRDRATPAALRRTTQEQVDAASGDEITHTLIASETDPPTHGPGWFTRAPEAVPIDTNNDGIIDAGELAEARNAEKWRRRLEDSGVTGGATPGVPSGHRGTPRDREEPSILDDIEPGDRYEQHYPNREQEWKGIDFDKDPEDVTSGHISVDDMWDIQTQNDDAQNPLYSPPGGDEEWKSELGLPPD